MQRNRRRQYTQPKAGYYTPSPVKYSTQSLFGDVDLFRDVSCQLASSFAVLIIIIAFLIFRSRRVVVASCIIVVHTVTERQRAGLGAIEGNAMFLLLASIMRYILTPLQKEFSTPIPVDVRYALKCWH